VIDDTPRFMPSLTDREAAAALDARERREEARNREGFKDCGLRAGETLQGLDGRVWRVLGPSVLRGSDPLVRVEEVATGRVGHRYARTVALWPAAELHLASIAERHGREPTGPPTRRGRRPLLPGSPPTPLPQAEREG
jgi:hypothetical protein